MTITDAIKKVVDRKSLSVQEAYETMMNIMSGAATPSQIASYLTALRMKGEDTDELVGAARVMRELADKVPVKKSLDLVDTCGTGGDAKGTFNISTAAAFVAAGAGAIVAKHGNRAVSSPSGSADVLTALGVNIEIPHEQTAECIEKIGIGFLFAPSFHKAMKYALPVRKELGIRTIFNMLGPLTNPACAKRQLIGVYSTSLVSLFPKVLKQLGSTRVMVVHGSDGLDEITLTGTTLVGELKGGLIRKYLLTPKSFDLPKIQSKDLAGGDSKDNAKIILGILDGKKSPQRDIVIANASAVLVVAGVAKDFLSGAKKANRSLDEGHARKKLDELIALTHKSS